MTQAARKKNFWVLPTGVEPISFAHWSAAHMISCYKNKQKPSRCSHTVKHRTVKVIFTSSCRYLILEINLSSAGNYRNSFIYKNLHYQITLPLKLNKLHVAVHKIKKIIKFKVFYLLYAKNIFHKIITDKNLLSNHLGVFWFGEALFENWKK